MKTLLKCPGCGGDVRVNAWRIPKQPVILNYRFASEELAASVRRCDMVLKECECCGLIFNAALRQDLIPYDENYENRQSYSAYFGNHLKLMAERVQVCAKGTAGRILEVGCGKGEFLKLVCERAGVTGVGYDTSYEGPARALKGKVRFHKSYVSASDLRARYDVILCRHVVEHVGGIGAFLCGLAEMARAAGDPVVMIETPAFEWIDQGTTFWDVFYEHCNYFTRPSLAMLCRMAGFRVVRHTLVFGRQYQWIELRLKRSEGARVRRGSKVASGRGRLEGFRRRADRAVREVEGRIRTAAKGGEWALWGAGAKGVAMVQWLRGLKPAFVIDSNPAKQGGYISGTRVPIVGPDDPRLKDLSLVVVMNPNYLTEISSTLRECGFQHRIITA